ncbi:MAG: ABC transporter substrate-binding protein [Zetaproteobacteria bacterium]|nr:ABC transporter substrate-binding protein [Pseudobdellovibrionaceae bacterium]
MVISRKWLTILATTALVSGLGGCTKNKDSETKADGSKPKIFNYLRTAAHKSLDPAKQFDAASAQIVSNVYDTLLQYDYLARPYKLVPGLVEKMPEKQKDGLTYIFTLRKGVVFHDDECFKDKKGRELTSDDAIYTIKRFADANVNVKSYMLIAGFVEGLDAFREQTKKLGIKKTDYTKLDVTGLRKIDNYSFSVKFNRENPLAFFPFAFSGMSIVPKEAVEKYGDDFAKNPVGTGPFYIKEYSRRGKMILAKNTKYFGTYPSEGSAEDKAAGLLADSGKKIPFLDEVHLPLIEEPQPAMLKFLKGEIHWIGMNKDDFSRMAEKDKAGKFILNAEYAKKFNMYTEPGLYAGFLRFNLNNQLVGKNKALRQAFAYALNTGKWIELMRNGRGKALKTIVPHPIAGSENDIDFEYYTQNIEMAKKKLAEAGYPGGKGLPVITIDYRSSNKDTRQDFEFVRNELAAVGIKVKANFQTFSAFLKRVESGNFQIIDAAWGADFPDGENFYQLLYGPNKIPGPNSSNFANKKYDELYEKSRFMENGQERFKLFKEMSEIVKEEVPLILRYNYLGFGLMQKNVRNLKRNMMVEDPYKYLNLGPEGKVSH